MANGDPFVRVAHEYMTETMLVLDVIIFFFDLEILSLTDSNFRILSQVRGLVNVPTLSPVANSFMQYCLIQ